MTIIMCDDDRNDLRMLRANVERFGEKHAVDLSIIELNELRNVAQIEALLEKQEVDAVFLDIDMPYISGDDVAEALVEKYPNLCIIFFTNREEMVFDVIRFKPYLLFLEQYLICLQQLCFIKLAWETKIYDLIKFYSILFLFQLLG